MITIVMIIIIIVIIIIVNMIMIIIMIILFAVPPKIHNLHPLNGSITVRSGSRVRLECRASGQPPPSIYWSRKVKMIIIRTIVVIMITIVVIIMITIMIIMTITIIIISMVKGHIWCWSWDLEEMCGFGLFQISGQI